MGLECGLVVCVRAEVTVGVCHCIVRVCMCVVMCMRAECHCDLIIKVDDALGLGDNLRYLMLDL